MIYKVNSRAAVNWQSRRPLAVRDEGRRTLAPSSVGCKRTCNKRRLTTRGTMFALSFGKQQKREHFARKKHRILRGDSLTKQDDNVSDRSCRQFEPDRSSQKKALAIASAFFNEAHLRCMKNEAGLCPMKRAFDTRRA